MITSAIEVARCDQVTIPAADFLGQARGPLVVTIGDRQVGPAPHQPEGDRPGHSPCPQDQHLLVEQRARVLGTVAAPHPRLERIHGRPIVGVVADAPAVAVDDDRVARPGPLHGPLLLLEQRDDRLLVGNRHAAPLDVQPEQLAEERLQLAVGDEERHQDLVQPQVAERGVMNRRAQALLDRIADDAVDLGLGVDLVVEVILLQDRDTGASPARRSARD